MSAHLSTGWLAQLPPALAAAVLSAGRTIALSPGQWVYGEGDDDTGLVIVLAGTLRLEAAVGDTRTVLVGLAPAGVAFGQSRRRGGGPRIVTARAAGAARVLAVGDHALERLGTAFPEIWRVVSEVVYAQLDASVHTVALLLALPPRARIAARLLTLAQDGAVRVIQSDLADLCGLSRKTASGHLSALAAAGAIDLGYGVIAVRDAALLASFADPV